MDRPYPRSTTLLKTTLLVRFVIVVLILLARGPSRSRRPIRARSAASSRTARAACFPARPSRRDTPPAAPSSSASPTLRDGSSCRRFASASGKSPRCCPDLRRRRKTIALEIGRTLGLEIHAWRRRSRPNRSRSRAARRFSRRATAEISDVIENREVVQLPLNGRNFLALAQLSDAVVIPPGGTRGEALQQAGPLPNVGGQRSGHNIYLLDGTKVTDELFNNLVINPSVDSIEEFKIQKSMYPAEFGGKASALINVATKAGSNVFHGSLFEFHRNDAFDSHELLPSGEPADSAAAPEPVRRRARRADRSEPDVLLRQLRRHAHAPVADADVLGADRRRSRRKFFRLRHRSAIR